MHLLLQQFITTLLLTIYQPSPPQQSDFWRDAIWQSIGVIASSLLAVVAIGVSVYIYFRQKANKSLQYEVVTNSQFIAREAQQQAGGKLRVLYDGVDVGDLRLVIIKLYNSGNTPILPTDYEKPMQFELGSASHILEVSVVDVQPSNLQVSTSHNDNKLFINPLLLNPRDTITVKILLDKISGKISANVRIAGINNIERYSKEQSRRRIQFATSIFSLIITILSILAAIAQLITAVSSRGSSTGF